MDDLLSTCVCCTFLPILTPGQLRGMLPCLGGSRHSFLSAAITPQQYKSSRTKDNEQCVYFNDGQGAVCCVQLGID